MMMGPSLSPSSCCCFFASNYPVDILPDQGAWTPDKLYPAFLKAAQAAGCSDLTIRRMFNQ